MRQFLAFMLVSPLLACAGESPHSDPASTDGLGHPGGRPGAQDTGGQAGSSGPPGDGGQVDLGGGQGFSCVVSADMPTDACRADYDEACSELSESECSANDNCGVLRARRVDTQLDCVEPEQQVVGCGALGCQALVGMAADPEGGTWVFPSTCHPLGWTEVASRDPVPNGCR